MRRFFGTFLLMITSFMVWKPTSASDVLMIPIYDQPRGNLIILEEGDKISGLYPDMFRVILEKAGIKFQFYQISQIRKNKNFADGKAVLDCCKNPNWVKKPQEVAVQLFSTPFYKSRDIFIFPKGKSFKIDSMEDLSDKKVAVIRGFGYLGQEWFGERYNLNNEQQLIQFVGEERADVGIINSVIAYTSSHIAHVDLGPVHDEAALHIRVHRSRADLLPKINTAIKALKDEGAFDRLESKYSSAF